VIPAIVSTNSRNEKLMRDYGLMYTNTQVCILVIRVTSIWHLSHMGLFKDI